MQANIEERVKKVIALQIDINGDSPVELKGPENLSHDLKFTDLDIVEITMGVEDEFGFEIDDDVMNGFATVQQIIDYATANAKA